MINTLPLLQRALLYIDATHEPDNRLDCPVCGLTSSLRQAIRVIEWERSQQNDMDDSRAQKPQND